jgi:hypothetical protein
MLLYPAIYPYNQQNLGEIMSTRAEKLAERIRAGAQALIEFVESCSDADWQKMVSNEERSVATLVHHVASMYPVEADVVKTLTEGNGLAVPWDAVHGMNAEHKENHGQPDKQETIDLIKKNSEIAAETVSGLTDEQLDLVGPISLNNNMPLSTQFFIEEHPIGHPYFHMASIKKVLT